MAGASFPTLLGGVAMLLQYLVAKECC